VHLEASRPLPGPSRAGHCPPGSLSPATGSFQVLRSSLVHIRRRLRRLTPEIRLGRRAPCSAFPFFPARWDRLVMGSSIQTGPNAFLPVTTDSRKAWVGERRHRIYSGLSSLLLPIQLFPGLAGKRLFTETLQELGHRPLGRCLASSSPNQSFRWRAPLMERDTGCWVPTVESSPLVMQDITDLLIRWHSTARLMDVHLLHPLHLWLRHRTATVIG